MHCVDQADDGLATRLIMPHPACIVRCVAQAGDGLATLPSGIYQSNQLKDLFLNYRNHLKVQ